MITILDDLKMTSTLDDRYNNKPQKNVAHTLSGIRRLKAISNSDVVNLDFGHTRLLQQQVR